MPCFIETMSEIEESEEGATVTLALDPVDTIVEEQDSIQVLAEPRAPTPEKVQEDVNDPDASVNLNVYFMSMLLQLLCRV